jgi:hypothetical protein
MNTVKRLTTDDLLTTGRPVTETTTTAPTGLDVRPAQLWHAACMPNFDRELNIDFKAWVPEWPRISSMKRRRIGLLGC